MAENQHREELWQRGRETGSGSVAEAAFWAAVEAGDLRELADRLAVDHGLLAELVPALASWRRRTRAESDVADWRYRVTWVPASDAGAAVLSGTWLAVIPQASPRTEDAAEAIMGTIGALTERGVSVLTVDVAPDELDRATLRTKVAEAAQAARVTGVVSFLAVDETPVPGHRAVPAGTAGTLLLVQALGDAGIVAPLWVITRGAVSTAPDETPASTAQAQVWGLGRIAGLEHRDRWGGLIDLPPDWDEGVAARLCAALGTFAEDQVAIRPSGTLARRLTRAAARRTDARTWAPAGTVLVTGATGGIGPFLGRWLAARGAERVVLTSRSGPWAADGETAEAVARLAARMAGQGTDVSLLACDLTERSQVVALLQRISAGGPPLKTVLHAADAARTAPFDSIGLRDLDTALGAKGVGALLLDELTQHLDLDRFVLFSSVAATWGGAEYAGQAASNAFLDALAQRRRACGLPATAVAWGVWDTDESTVYRDPARLMRQGLNLLAPDRALAALEQVLADDETVVTVADIDWARFAPVFRARRYRPLLDGLPEVRALAAVPRAQVAPAAPADLTTNTDPDSAVDLADTLLALPAADRERHVVDLVRTHAAAVLGHASADAVDPTRAFHDDMGFDSLIATDLRNRLSGATGLVLPPTVVFDYPSATALARQIIARLPGPGPSAQAPAQTVATEATDTETDTATATAAETDTATADTAASDDPIAVIGMGCRFPGGVASPEQLWELLASGGDAISGPPTDRGWDLARLSDQQGGFLHGVTRFDPGFFGISPRDAITTDPQQRLLLEICWEAVERAGIDPETLRGTPTGLFTGTADGVLSGRVSAILGLEGPAVTVDTACSSSLVALHLACQSIRSGESTTALAGGVMVLSDPEEFEAFSRRSASAADGRCKSFSDSADGTGIAEGAGVILLERLSDARRLGRPVLAVIKGSATSQDGESSGPAASSGPAQERVIRAALAAARLTASDVDAVEAHGSGTAHGDPIEARALLAAYGQDRPEDLPLYLGSVKSNIGHTQHAAGIAGVIKMVQALRENLLPATLHADTPSSLVDWTAGDIRLLTDVMAWPSDPARPRRAGVSAFGLTGTDAHVILEEAPLAEEAEADALDPEVPILAGSDVHAWIVSGRGVEGLAGQAGRLREHVLVHRDQQTADIAWSLVATRGRFDHRAVVVGRSRAELIAGLAAVATKQTSATVVTGVARGTPHVGFVFAGQGAQRAGMGRSLYAASPIFAATFDQVTDILEAELGLPVADVVLGRATGVNVTADTDADQTIFAQTGLFAVQVALVEMLAAAGVRPDAVAGHSVGEIAAAWAAGVLPLEDACRLVAHRARLMQSLPAGGAMCTIAATEAEVLDSMVELRTRKVCIGAVNDPHSTVISGAAAEVDRVAELWRRRGRRVRALRVSHAFHSVLIDPILEELGMVAAGLTLAPPRIAWAQATTGQVAAECAPSYWTEQARQPLRFADAVSTLAERGVTVFLEIGPDGTLSAIGSGAVSADKSAIFIPLLRSTSPASLTVATALARAHVLGVDVDWAAVFGVGARVDLPTYAFQHETFWPQRGIHTAQDGSPAQTAAESDFWGTVEEGDVSQLSDILAVDAARLAEVLPALAAWRRRDREETTLADWRYRVTWVPLADPGVVSLSGTWLVIVPSGFEDATQKYLRALTTSGATVVTLTAEHTDLDRTTLGRSLSQLAATAGDAPITGILSLLALDESALEEVPLDESPRTARTLAHAAVAGTLFLVQALGDAGITAPLWTVTSGAVATGQGDALESTAQAQVWGLGRVAGLEHPERWGGLVDVPRQWDERVVARFCAVLSGLPGDEDQVAVRSSGLVARRLVRAAPSRESTSWTPGGSVLITGCIDEAGGVSGIGGIGEAVARWVADRGAERVVLTGSPDAGAAGISRLAADLAALGTRVDVVACDLSTCGGVSGLVARIAATGPVLTSLFHAAAVGEDVAIEDYTLDHLAQVTVVTAASAKLLDEFTADLDLDAFVLFSSVAVTWGSGSQPGNAAANAYLEALAEMRRSRGQVATAIAWGQMDSRLGIRALAQVVDGRESEIVIADVDWQRFAPRYTERRASPLFELLPEAREALGGGDSSGVIDAELPGELAQRLAGASRPDQDRLLVDLVQAEAAQVLGHASADAVAMDRAFHELGFDSLAAMELRNRLATATGLTLPATLAFDYPTPAILADHLRDELLGTGTDAVPEVVAAAVSDEPIAIVGMGCRLPGGVGGPEQLWDLVMAGVDAMSPFPQDRGWDAYVSQDATSSRVGGFVHDATEFDAGFFGISPREAVAMDPQQRLLLEVAWEALEHAGIDPHTLRGSATGVFAGASGSGYDPRLGARGRGAPDNAASAVSGRVAYVLGLEGPAVTVDTACSSSLVALHLACQALRSGECAMALAGGVTVMATPGPFGDSARQRGTASDGRCKAFSDDADGTGWAEGAGLLVLERLSEAERNGHPVLAIVRGSAVNQDGASNGLTAPNGPAQQRVIRAALANARLTAADVDVVEAHGSGTMLGDPIEAQALLATYGRHRPADRPLRLGTVKSNIGHAQQAAGVVGVIKMVMALRRGVLPRTLHAEVPSTHVDWSAGHLRLLHEAVEWAPDSRPRRAGVSAFGLSGTNAHVIVEEAPMAETAEGVAGGPAADQPRVPWVSQVPRVPRVLDAAEVAVTAWTISARSAEALAAQASRLRDFALASSAQATDIAWSLATTRSGFEHRAVVVGAGDALAAGLTAIAAGRPGSGVVSGVVSGSVPVSGPGRLVFVFPGEGGQWIGMGRELLAASPVFAVRFAECAEALAPYVDWSLYDALDGQLETSEQAEVVLWAVAVSLAAVWQAAGVVPDAVVGHARGEAAAAVVAGVLSLEDGARAVVLRPQVLTPTPLSEEVGVPLVCTGTSGEFDRAIRGLVSSGHRTFIEVSPHPVLNDALESAGAAVIISTLRRDDGGPARLLKSLAEAHVGGVEVDWTSVLEPGTRTDLPTYAFQHQRYWPRNPDPLTAATDRTTAGAVEDKFWAAVDRGDATTLATSLGVDDDQLTGLLPALATWRHRERTAAALADWRYRIAWTPLPDTPGTLTGSWLVATGSLHDELTHQVVRALTERGAHAVLLPIAADELDGADLADRIRTLSLESPFTGVVSLLALDEERLPDSPAIPRGTAATALLIQALTETDSTATLWTLTRGAVSTGPTDQLTNPVQAQAWGLGRVAALELPDRWGGLIDLPQQWDERVAGRLVGVLAGGGGARAAGGAAGLAAGVGWGGSASSASSTDSASTGSAGARRSGSTVGSVGSAHGAALAAGVGSVRLDGLASGAGSAGSAASAASTGLVSGGPLAFTVGSGDLPGVPSAADYATASVGLASSASSAEPASVSSRVAEDQVAIRPAGVLARRLVHAPAASGGSEWVPRGSVLITGGTGGVGGHTARWLAGRGAARVVLASRSGAAAPSAASLAAELAGAGTGVDIVACDVAQRSQATAVLARIPALTGVFHAAGVSVRGSELAEHLAAKADGATWLHELTASLDLEAFVVFSSVAATWGSRSLAGYAAANAYLDALVDSRIGRGLPGTSVAWGLWGAGQVSREIVEEFQGHGLRAMDSEACIRALAQVLDGDRSSITIADVDWDKFAQTFTLHRPSPLIAGLPGSIAPAADAPQPPSEPDLATRLAALPELEQTRLLVDLVRGETATVLGYPSADAVEADCDFGELGIDSVTAVELRNRITAATGLRLPSTLVYDCPSATAVADYLYAELISVTARPAASDDPIAIVAMGCRLPGGVGDPEQLWHLLADGTDTDGRIHDAAEFDAAFFGIAPEDAAAMDPQQRMLLEVAWETIERAALNPHTLRGTRTGVFVGATYSGYGAGSGSGFGAGGSAAGSGDSVRGGSGDGSSGTGVGSSSVSGFGAAGSGSGVRGASGDGSSGTGVGSSFASGSGAAGSGDSVRGGFGAGSLGSPTAPTPTAAISGRVASVLGLEGPAVTVDTACSSSLVALHLACQSLRSGECEMALAGGVSVLAGTIGRGEGAGLLLLERVSDARRNGHPVLAVVKGSAVSQGGEAGAPSGPAQQRVIRAALAAADLTPDDVDVVETHGAGLGDPIEARALAAAYGRGRPKDKPLWLGSAKPNVGHLQTASGVVGVMKMVLALQHSAMPQTLPIEDPAPQGNIRLLQETRPWPAGGQPRRAGVSAFGASGTNVHVILEEAAADPAAVAADADDHPTETPRPPILKTTPVTAWPLSARSPEALAAQAGRLREFILSHPDQDPASIAWSLATTRSTFEHRAVVIGADPDELATGLAALATGHLATATAATLVTSTVPPADDVRTVFVFPGDGGHWPGMGRELLATSPVFAARFAECAEALAPFLDRSPYDLLNQHLETPDHAQPLLWAMNLSLAALWQAAGVEPDAVLGHAHGEHAAAVVAGTLSLADGARRAAQQTDRDPAANAAHAADDFDQSIRTLADVGHHIFIVVSPHPVLTDTIHNTLQDRAQPATAPATVVLSTLRRNEGGPARLLASLAEAHVHGASVDWSRLTHPAERLVLPTYAFQRKHYWATTAPVTASTTPTPTTPTGLESRFWTAVEQGDLRDLADTLALDASRPLNDLLPALASWRRRAQADAAVADWRYRVSWVRLPDPATAVLTGTWLLVVPQNLPENDLVANIRSALTDRGANIAMLEVPITDLDRTTLAARLSSAVAGPIAGVVSLLAFDEQPVPGFPAVPAGVAGTLLLLQALGNAGIEAKTWALTSGAVGAAGRPSSPVQASLGDAGIEARTWALTSGAVSAAGRPSSPLQAEVWGLGRVAALEHRDRWGGLIDLPATWDTRTAVRLCAALADGTEDQLALRPAGTLARRVVRAAARRGSADWTPSGTVLVTGATGEIGPHVAEWLTTRGAEHVVLTSRRGPAPAGVEARVADLVARMAARGTEVRVLACDLTDRDDVTGLLAGIAYGDGPPLKHILHIANAGRTAPLDSTGLSDLDAALGAKASGAAWLDELTRDLDLDDFVLFSSIAAVWGSAEHAAHAAGNAFLDALAEDRRGRGLPATSVAWGAWATRSNDVPTPVTAAHQGTDPLAPDHALTALGQALADGETFLAVADIDWNRSAAAQTAAQTATSNAPHVPPAEAESRFWTAVEQGDLRQVTATLDVGAHTPLREVLPALAAWRRRDRERSTAASWRYRVSWVPVVAVDAASSPALTGEWLIVTSSGREQLTEDCATALREYGAQTSLIEITAHGLDRTELADRIARVQPEEGFAGVLSLAALDESPLADHPTVNAGLSATVLLAQAMGAAGVEARLWAVTEGAVVAAAGDVLDSPAQARIWGLGRVVALEHPQRWGGLIDLTQEWDDRCAAQLCAVLAGCGEDQVALRPSGVLARRLVHAPVNAGATEQGSETSVEAAITGGGGRWQPRGTVLVTGGTGAIGSRVARWSAARGAARLVLISRSGPTASGAASLAAQLAASGARVDVLTCDVAVRAEVSALLARIGSDGPALSSVLHAAGISRSCPVRDLGLDELTDELAAKGAGTDALDELTQDFGLDAFVLFSSSASTWGGGMRGGSAAANAYMDAVAERRRQRGLPATSVAWGLWGGGGLGAGHAGDRAQRHGMRYMDPDIAMRALAQVLDGDDGVITIADVDWQKFARTFTLHRPSPLIASLPEVRSLLPTAKEGSDTQSGPAAAVDEPLAVIGIGCRFPGGVRGPDDLWELVATGTDAVGGFPADRGGDVDGGPGRPGGYLADAAEFDAGFFGIGPREALATDPQQRLLLEVSWEALERAGIDPHSLRGSQTGVFAGGWTQGYSKTLPPEALHSHAPVADGGSAISGRVSSVLGLEGPAISVDTACSSSLVAIHLAGLALRSGECDLALVGGVTVMPSPSPRGSSLAGEADSRGLGEGAAILVVERLADAHRNGREILAVIRSSAVNGGSQQRVIHTALAGAGLTANDVDAVEAHGSGTVFDDPIEAGAVFAAYSEDRPKERPLWLGSIESNIGHTQAAAGVAGVIKMVMALRHGLLPRTLHTEHPAPHVDWTAGNVKLLSAPVPWPADGARPRRAGVSGFGISGTNAHVIVEEAPVSQAIDGPVVAEGVGADADSSTASAGQAGRLRDSAPVHPVLSNTGVSAWLVSARSADALAGQAGRLREFALARPGLDPADVAWSLATTRATFAHRAVVIGASRAQLAMRLAAVATAQPVGGAVVGSVPGAGPGRTVFVFPGAGSQWPGMGRELLDASPVFAARFAECAAALSAHGVAWSALDVIRQEEGAPAIEHAAVAQPVTWAVTVALAAVWEAAGVRLDAVVGHGHGEIAAATVAGMLSLADAAKVVVARSHALATLNAHGGLLSVVLAEPEVVEILHDFPGLSVTAANSPAATVVAGTTDDLEALAAVLAKRRILCWRVPATDDFVAQTASVEPTEADLTAALAAIRPAAGSVPFYSTALGRWVSGSELDAGYWYANIRQPVRFADAVTELAGSGYRTFIEVTTQPVLGSAITETAEAGNLPAPVVAGTVRREDAGAAGLLASLATVHVAGVAVDWAAVLGGGRRVELPTYAFQHSHFWPKTPGGSASGAAELGLNPTGHPLLGAAVELAGGAGWLLTGCLSQRTHPWLADHVVHGAVVLPGAAFVELALVAGYQAGVVRLEDLTLETPLALPAKGAVHVQVSLGAADADGSRPVEVYSRLAAEAEQQGPWTLHARGLLGPARKPSQSSETDLTAWPPAGAQVVDVHGFYEAAAAGGHALGPSFHGLRAVWRRGGDVFAEVALPADVADDASRFGLHPALFDAAQQAAVFITGAGGGQTRLSFGWHGVSLEATGARALRVRLRQDEDGGYSLTATDFAGSRVLAVDSLLMRRAVAEQSAPTDQRGPGDQPVAAADRRGLSDALFTVDWTALPAITAAPIGRTRWAVLGADSEQLARDLAAAGVDVRSHASLAQLVRAVEGGELLPDLVLAPMTRSDENGEDDDDVAAVACELTVDALGLLQEWLVEDRLGPARLAVVTRGAVAAEPGEGVADVAAAAVWGLVRSAQSENPDRLVLFDLPGGPLGDGAAELLVAALGAAESEPELALRGSVVRARRLVRPLAGLPLPGGGEPWRLAASGRLVLVPYPQASAKLRPGQVRVAVRAAGLNAADLAAASATTGDNAPVPVGSEISGVVLESTTPVLKAGDRVFGFAPGSIGPVAVVDAGALALMPAAWTFAEAAAAPIDYTTAAAANHEGLHTLYQNPDGTVERRHLLAEAAKLPAPTPRAWDVRRASEAFRAAAVGHEKIVLTIPLEATVQRHLGSILITGGTGTLGALVAERYAAGGRAAEIILSSRLGPLAPGAAALAARLAGSATPVRIVACDAADERALAGLLANVPLTGVIHAAGARDDGVVGSLTAERIAGVMQSKAVSAWNLHRATRNKDLDTFVLFSSAAATLGTPGQGSDAAANAFLDALAEQRRAGGLPGHALGWGSWADGGVDAEGVTGQTDAVLRGLLATGGTDAAARRGESGEPGRVGIGVGGLRAETGRREVVEHSPLGSSGVSAITAEEGLHLLDLALSRDEPLLVPIRLSIPTLRAVARAGRLPACLRALAPVPRAVRETTSQLAGRTLRERLDRAAEPEQIRILTDLVRSEAAAILGHDSPEAVAVDATFVEQGFDSLTAVELRNRLSAITGLQLTGTMAFDHPTPGELAPFLHKKLAPARGTRISHGGSRYAVADTGTDGRAPTLSASYPRAVLDGRLPELMALARGLAAFRPRFATASELSEVPEATVLSRGPQTPHLICFSSFASGSDPQEYARFAAGFRGRRAVSVVPIPGFAAGEPLAAGIGALVDVCAVSARRAGGGKPVVLVGFGSGGLIAQAVAARLGTEVAGLVLVDTDVPEGDGRSEDVQAGHRTVGGDEWLTALAHYASLDWRGLPSPAVPTLSLRTRAGDHLSMLRDHGSTTAQAVIEWLNT